MNWTIFFLGEAILVLASFIVRQWTVVLGRRGMNSHQKAQVTLFEDVAYEALIALMWAACLSVPWACVSYIVSVAW